MRTDDPEAKGVGKRAYIIGADFRPVYVGIGLGDLDHQDAVSLGRLKAATQSRPVNTATRGQAWIDYRGTSEKTRIAVRASKHNPYICRHCGYRSTRYSNILTHLEKVHKDFQTDPRENFPR